MAAHPLQDFIRRLCRAHSVAEEGHLTDAQLLERFAQQRDEAAFEVLVWRHGALVLKVAQRLVRRPADTEDVFQATFLTLARKAASIRRGTSVGSWLYKVAYRIALRVRQATTRREYREKAGIEDVAAIAPPEREDTEAAAMLAEEVGQLPERYRAAVVLCYLQGSTTEEAARVLGCPRGTILSRLAWARHRLRNRLVRRGLAPAVAVAAVSFGETASAMPSLALVTSVIRAALPFAAGRAAVSTVSPQVVALVQGALQTMMWNKIKIAVMVMCAIGLAGAGSAWLAQGRDRPQPATAVAERPPKQPAPRAAEVDREKELQKQTLIVREQLEKLAVQEEAEGKDISGKAIDARLWLIECRDRLQRRETELLERLGERVLLRKLGSDRSEFLRHDRKQLFQAEEALRQIETKQVQQRELAAAKRDALLARLQQLEGMSLHLDPADRLRDLERKLDALRRDVGELRRGLKR